MRKLDDNSVDSIVTDPPYELGFMGKSWDSTGIAYNVDVWREALRVLKPGGHLIAFSGTRTYHRMASAIEDAGFEIRDMMQWLHGSGMPHGQDISKSIDKKLGKTREVIGRSHNGSGAQPNKLNNHAHGDTGIGYADGSGKIFDITAPASDEAKQRSGWNTHLKPSCEPMVLARKPLSEKTVADNVLRWGTGGLNIEDSRIGYQSVKDKEKCGFHGRNVDSDIYGKYGTMPPKSNVNTGRFPANVLLDETAAAILDEQSGTLTSGKVKPEGFVGKYTGNIYGKFAHNQLNPASVYGDSGGASRFFYCSKASKKERGDGNIHPTVKPLKLMEYLVTLVTPPNGVVLDPFAGSGTTGIAAKNKGFGFVGIEQNDDYCEIARRRID